MTDPIYEIYDKLCADKILLENKIKTKQNKIKKLKKEHIANEKARIVFLDVYKEVQNETKEYIEKLVTHAIQFVFENRDYTFKLELEDKNNRVHATPIITEGNTELDPKEDIGGGIIDIVAVALKIIIWHMHDPRSRNVIILDEPFRCTGALITKAGYMIKYLSEKLNIQIILISHNNELIKICDKIFHVHRKGTESIINIVSNKEEKKIKRRDNAKIQN